MKPNLIYLLTIVLTTSIIGLNGQQCVECDNNSTTGGNFATALGQNTAADGNASLAAGAYSVASGSASISLGLWNISEGRYSTTIGSYCKAKANSSIVIGNGDNDDHLLVNPLSYTLMIGMNSDKPTFFVSMSEGFGKTGRVSIGNMTSPDAKLHIYSDDNEDASLYLQPSNWGGGYNAKLMLGTSDYWLKTDNTSGMQFNSPDGYVIQAGNIQTVLINEGSFEVQGTTKTTNFRMYDASNPPADGYVLRSDGSGNAEWANPLTIPGGWQENGNGTGIYYQDGVVGIGTIDTYGAMLAVKGKIYATEVLINHEADWYDHVFEKDYALKSIYDLESFITKYKHLPDVPSAKEVEENGINVGQMEGVLLKKIEELTLYLIEQQKQIDMLSQQLKQQNPEN